MIVLKPLQSLQSYLEIKKNLELLTQSNLYFLLNLIEKENFKLKGIGMNLARPPSLYFIQRNSLKGNNFEITPSLLEMYIIKLGLLISQELSYFLQHKFPPKSVFNFKFSDFIFHFTEFFNKIANSKEKINKFNKNEIIISAEILKDLPDIIMGDCERMEEILGFILFPIIRKFHDLVRVVITCDFYKNDELVENKCNFLFSLEIIRKKDDEELEKFLKSQIFEYANKTQSEIYEIILKNLENEELFVTGLNLLPFLLKILDNDYFDITSLEYSTNIKFVIPFLTEQTGKSPTNFLKYNEINLDYFYSRINSRKKLNEKEYDVYRLEKKNQRSFEDFSNAFIKIIEPNSSDSVKGSSSKSSPLKKNRNHKGLREDLLKLVSPENSINSASIEIKINKLNSGSIYRVKKELKFCSNVFEFHKILEKMERKEKELSKNQPNSEKSALMKKQMSFKEKTNDLQSVITNNIENSIEILQEEYKKTLEKTVIECLNLKENIALNEIHEELFNLIVDENKFAFMNQRKDNFQKKIIEKKKFCHSNFSRKKEINKGKYN